MNSSLLVKLILIFITSYSLYYFSQSRRTSSSDQHILTIATNAEYKPFSYIENDTIIGFDIDIIMEIAQRLGKTVVLKNMSFEAIIPELQLGKSHIGAAGFTPTFTRAQQVLFSTPYLLGDPLVIVTKKEASPLSSVAQLSDKKVLVNQGFTADIYLSDQLNAQLLRVNTIAEAFTALNGNRADAFVSAKSALQPFFDQYDSSNYHIHEIPEKTETYAFAIAKKYPELHKKIEMILEQMDQDGTLDEIKRTWKL